LLLPSIKDGRRWGCSLLPAAAIAAKGRKRGSFAD
jgi:hypothetical protein